MLRKLVLPAVLVMGMNASADDSYYKDARGLIGIELGYVATQYQGDSGKLDINDEPIVDRKTVSSPSIGMKLGAESDHYRFFVEGRVWHTNEYNTGASAGAALQYLIPIDERFHIYMGVNVGAANALDAQWDPYGGADAGVNLHVNKDFDVEIGGRYSAVDVNSDDLGKINSFYGAYVTGIFKFSGDY